ncbi:MAG TPA: Gfo/Idh/MocA family oxidoreductase [bacterium]|nr:Gfo/Idh/MocA family oxidoreductase [bacterium]HOL49239.1 Gfo/Idh/MocA family oxidoreductase [bacterium]HPO52187.1 Gfo/Idh/MocA family oxidoreductase [bacterium]
MKKIKIGVIGAGGISHAHIEAFKQLPDIEVAAISDPNETKLSFVAEKYGILKRFANWEDLLKEQIDIVSICSPNAFHAQQAISALKAGKHVICEKPVAMSVEEAESILETAKQTGNKFMVAFCHRFAPHSQFIKKMVNAGQMGELYYAKASCLRRRGIPGLGTWFTTKKLAGGGPLIDIGVHILDLAIYLMGCPEPKLIVGVTYNKFKNQAVDGGWPPVWSRVGDKPTGTFDVEDLAAGFIRFKNNTTLFLEASWAGNSEVGLKISLFGTKSGVQYWTEAKPPLKIYGDINGVVTDATTEFPSVNVYHAEIEHFVNCVRNNIQPITTPEEIITVIKIIQNIYKSAETGKPVEL